jgi:hypothetical protein
VRQQRVVSKACYLLVSKLALPICAKTFARRTYPVGASQKF